jgi:hypothetical protein
MARTRTNKKNAEAGCIQGVRSGFGVECESHHKCDSEECTVNSRKGNDVDAGKT